MQGVPLFRAAIQAATVSRLLQQHQQHTLLPTLHARHVRHVPTSRGKPKRGAGGAEEAPRSLGGDVPPPRAPADVWGEEEGGSSGTTVTLDGAALKTSGKTSSKTNNKPSSIHVPAQLLNPLTGDMTWRKAIPAVRRGFQIEGDVGEDQSKGRQRGKAPSASAGIDVWSNPSSTTTSSTSTTTSSTSSTATSASTSTSSEVVVGINSDSSSWGETGEEKVAMPYTDFMNPHMWYPQARTRKRKIIIHRGPTNSGKTYHAIETLKAAGRGIYLAPLRLLAWETYYRMNEAGFATNLLTGQEKEKVADASFLACTVEMATLRERYPLCVIDECQIIGDTRRGWAWTRAILGVNADVIVCIEDGSCTELIKRLCQITGDEVEVREFQRLSPIAPDRAPLQKIGEIRKGDCIVAFSRERVVELKADVEFQTGKKTAMVYGALPPETRREQARNFNDPESGFDVLVATDAIGMGLNLQIGRVIFDAVEKFDGEKTRKLTDSELYQIGSRAGRYASEFPEGRVTCFQHKDFATIQRVFSGGKRTPTQQDKAGLTFSLETLEYALTEYEKSPDLKKKLTKTSGPKQLLSLIEMLEEELKVHTSYFLCNHDDVKAIATALVSVPLTLPEAYCFAICPAKTNVPSIMKYLVMFATKYAKEKRVDLKVTCAWNMPTSPRELQDYETLYSILEIYVWLSYQFGEFAFPSRTTAIEMAEQCASLISASLDKESHSRTLRVLRKKSSKGLPQKGATWHKSEAPNKNSAGVKEA